MNKSKSIILGMVLVLALSLVAFSETASEKIEAYLASSFSFQVDGQAWTPMDVDGSPLSPVVFKGRTYLPARALLEDRGVKVGWDSNTSTVILDYPAPIKPLDKATPLLFDKLTARSDSGAMEEVAITKNPNLELDVSLDLSYDFALEASTPVYLNDRLLEGELPRLKEVYAIGALSSVRLGLADDGSVVAVYLYDDPDSDGDGLEDAIEDDSALEIDFVLSGPPYTLTIKASVK